MEKVDAVVIGAGVVGLAVARRLALAGREVVVLEAEGAIGTGASSRNSEVIHAGIYYPAGSWKARLCVVGRRALYAYCLLHRIEHRAVGKLIVAIDDSQRHTLRGILAKGEANGVEGLEWLEADQAKAMEPALACVAAIHSPHTGIIDSHGLMLALQGDAEAAGAAIAFHSPVTGAALSPQGIVLDVGGAQPMRIAARIAVNAAGLGAVALARGMTGLRADLVPRAHRAKGNYFVLSGRPPFSRLIYPMPEAAALGIHLTLDLTGRARFGPDIEWVEDLDYAVAPVRGDRFYADIRRYWPGLPDGALMPGYSGIRPKIHGPGEPQPDFSIQGPEAHGVPGLVNLFGIESPGLTACLALGDAVAERLGVGQPQGNRVKEIDPGTPVNSRPLDGGGPGWG